MFFLRRSLIIWPHLEQPYQVHVRSNNKWTAGLNILVTSGLNCISAPKDVGVLKILLRDGSSLSCSTFTPPSSHYFRSIGRRKSKGWMWDSGHSGRAGDSRASSGRRFLVNTPTVRTPQRAPRKTRCPRWSVKPMFCFESVLYTQTSINTNIMLNRGCHDFILGTKYNLRGIVQNQILKSFTQGSYSRTQSFK